MPVMPYTFMYVDEHAIRINGKTYTGYLIRGSYRDKGKIKHRTIANISKCSPEEISAIKLALKYNQIPEPRELGMKLIKAP